MKKLLLITLSVGLLISCEKKQAEEKVEKPLILSNLNEEEKEELQFELGKMAWMEYAYDPLIDALNSDTAISDAKFDEFCNEYHQWVEGIIETPEYWSEAVLMGIDTMRARVVRMQTGTAFGASLRYMEFPVGPALQVLACASLCYNIMVDCCAQPYVANHPDGGCSDPTPGWPSDTCFTKYRRCMRICIALLN